MTVDRPYSLTNKAKLTLTIPMETDYCQEVDPERQKSKMASPTDVVSRPNPYSSSCSLVTQRNA